MARESSSSPPILALKWARRRGLVETLKLSREKRSGVCCLKLKMGIGKGDLYHTSERGYCNRPGKYLWAVEEV